MTENERTAAVEQASENSLAGSPLRSPLDGLQWQQTDTGEVVPLVMVAADEAPALTRLEAALLLVEGTAGRPEFLEWYRERVLATGGTDSRLDTLDSSRRVRVTEQPPFPVPFGVGDVLPAPLLGRHGAALVLSSGRLWQLGSWEWERISDAV
jgi:hypothetical protein